MRTPHGRFLCWPARAGLDGRRPLRSRLALGALDAPEVPFLLEPLLKEPFSDVRDYAKTRSTFMGKESEVERP